MKKYEVNGIKKCQELINWLHEHNYHMFQLQYDATKPEGFFIWFIHETLEQIEIHTYKPLIQDMLEKYKKAPTLTGGGSIKEDYVAGESGSFVLPSIFPLSK